MGWFSKKVKVKEEYILEDINGEDYDISFFEGRLIITTNAMSYIILGIEKDNQELEVDPRNITNGVVIAYQVRKKIQKTPMIVKVYKRIY